MTGKTGPFLTILLVAVFGCKSNCDKKEDTEIDRLWRAGYGYNNPNPQRQKEGRPPVNFDGSVHDD